MAISRREFVRGGVAAFTVSFAAPSFLSDLARAQGRSQRNLVVLYLSGGNDALSTLIPYTDQQVLRAAAGAGDPGGERPADRQRRRGQRARANPRLAGLKSIFDSRPPGDHPAHRLSQLEPLAFPRHGHLVHRRSGRAAGDRMAGRYLDTLPSPVDPLTAWSTMRETPRTLLARTVGVPSIPSVAGYAFASPNSATDAAFARDSALRIASHAPSDRPHLAFVNATAQGAFATLDRVAQVGTYVSSVDLREQRVLAGAARRRRRDLERRRHQGVLGADRRL